MVNGNDWRVINMYKYIISYDGGFLRDSADFEWGVYDTYEETQEDAELAKDEYIDGWKMEDEEYDPDLFEVEIEEV